MALNTVRIQKALGLLMSDSLEVRDAAQSYGTSPLQTLLAADGLNPHDKQQIYDLLVLHQRHLVDLVPINPTVIRKIAFSPQLSLERITQLAFLVSQSQLLSFTLSNFKNN